MLARHLMVICTLALTAACSSVRREKVNYTVYRMPNAGFKKIEFLGVVGSKNTSKSQMSLLAKKVNSCGQYRKTTSLQKSYKLAQGDYDDVRRSFRKLVKRERDDRYTHGVLFFDLQLSKGKSRKIPTSIVKARYKAPYDWHDSFEITADVSNKTYAFEEIAKKPSYYAAKAKMKNQHLRVKARYALFNAKKGSLVFDKDLSLKATLSNYSKNPRIKFNDLRNMVYKQIVEKVSRNACPQVGKAEREIVARTDGGRVDQMVLRGVELASENRWEKAASKWQNAILEDKSHALAHHNLGVYYERKGNIPKSIEEFERAEKNDLIKENQLELAMHQFRPEKTQFDLAPRLLAVSSSNWVTVTGGETGDLKIGKTYPLYRSSRLTNKNFSTRGVHLMEVGKIKVEKVDSQSPPQYSGRIIEFAAKQQIKPGDMVIAN